MGLILIILRLIKIVLQDIPVYWMALVVIPIHILSLDLINSPNIILERSKEHRWNEHGHLGHIGQTKGY